MPTRASVVVAVLIFAASWHSSVHAICFNSRLISSADYIYTPGVVLGDESSGLWGTSVTAQFQASFWALTAGDPLEMRGTDNGSFATFDWIHAYPGYPPMIHTHWAADQRIDGCIDDLGSPKRMAILLSDVNPLTNEGVYALLTATADNNGNYSFSGAAPQGSKSGNDAVPRIELAPIPAPRVSTVTAVLP